MVTLTPGASSYFSAPVQCLDPSLFDSRNQMHAQVRVQLLGTLYGYLRSQFHDPESWSTVWLAGSGASYQWSAARDPGDLDILIGVDYIAFRKANPRYVGLSDNEVSQLLNSDLQQNLWPQTADLNVGGTRYEVTWYNNPGATDIRVINPYAAYNISDRTWTVAPNPDQHAPSNPDWERKSAEDYTHAVDILGRYEQGDTDALHEGAALFDEIHTGRHTAFGPGGAGFADWTNFRWQSGKRSGVVPALHVLKDRLTEEQKQRQLDTYGEQLDDTSAVLLKAALWRAKR